jgi:hypothetical protein
MWTQTGGMEVQHFPLREGFTFRARLLYQWVYVMCSDIALQSLYCMSCTGRMRDAGLLTFDVMPVGCRLC